MLHRNNLPSHRRSDRSSPWPVLLALPILIAACGGESASASATGSDEGPQIIATTSIWADVVSNVACDGTAAVQSLIPLGGDPHGFEPSLADRGRLEDASLIVANGLLLEEGLEDTLDAVTGGGTPIFEVAEHVETIAYAGSNGHDEDHDDEDDHDEDHADEDDHDEDEDHADEDHDEDDEDDHDEDEDEDHADEDEDEHGHDGDDPHVWFDPVRVSAALPALADRLVEDAGLDRAMVDDCVADYQVELSELNAEIEEMVDGLNAAQRVLVTNHDSLGYFADRYGFDVIGTIIPAPSGLAETNPAQLEALAKVIEETGVPAVFGETQRATDDADALADRVGDIAVVPLPTGTLGDGADSYIEFMRSNAALITEALQQAQG